MHVTDANALLMQIFGEVLGHAFRQHGAERAVTLGGGLADFAENVVHLAAGGAYLHRRIDQSCRTDDLFGEDAAGLFQFP